MARLSNAAPEIKQPSGKAETRDLLSSAWTELRQVLATTRLVIIALEDIDERYPAGSGQSSVFQDRIRDAAYTLDTLILPIEKILNGIEGADDWVMRSSDHG